MDQPTSNKSTVAIAKWIATACRPVNIVEDEGLCDIIRIASKDTSYELPSRSVIVNRIHELYETERAKLAQDLELTATIALMDTSLGRRKICFRFGCIACIMPSVSVMESSEDYSVNYIVKFKQTYTLVMEKRKGKTNSTWLKISTALVPRFKNLKCLDRSERAEVWALIAGFMRVEMLAQEPVETVTSEPPQKKAALLVASESESDEEEDCIEKCLERCRAEPVISMEDCPLEWWSKHAGSHPKLACLARKCLATPATSGRL
ncbi:hypothetical protein AOLI_G00134980 [Acnodon oligacanthus]